MLVCSIAYWHLVSLVTVICVGSNKLILPSQLAHLAKTKVKSIGELIHVTFK